MLVKEGPKNKRECKEDGGMEGPGHWKLSTAPRDISN